MKCSSCKHGCCSRTYNFLSMIAFAAFVSLAVVFWYQWQGKSLKIFGIQLSKNKISKDSKPLLVNKDGVVATFDDFMGALSIIDRGEPGMQFIASLPEKEQIEIYNRIINDYLVPNYLIKKYFEKNDIENSTEFQNELNNYMEVMTNTFRQGFFQKKIDQSIVISDEQAKTYYENARYQVPELMNPPFTLEAPGIEARAVRMEDGKKASDYAQRLKNNKDVMNLGRVNSLTRGITPAIVTALEEMKDGEVKQIELGHGGNFALYRVSKHEGKWEDYNDSIAVHVKQMLRLKTLESRCQEILSEIKEKEGLVIEQSSLENFVQERISKKQALDEVLSNEMDELRAKEFNSVPSNTVEKQEIS